MRCKFLKQFLIDAADIIELQNKEITNQRLIIAQQSLNIDSVEAQLHDVINSLESFFSNTSWGISQLETAKSCIYTKEGNCLKLKLEIKLILYTKVIV